MFKALLDSKDSSIELHLTAVAVSFLFLLFLTTWSVVNGNDFDPTNFAGSVGLLLGGSGLAAVGEGINRKLSGGRDGD